MTVICHMEKLKKKKVSGIHGKLEEKQNLNRRLKPFHYCNNYSSNVLIKGSKQPVSLSSSIFEPPHSVGVNLHAFRLLGRSRNWQSLNCRDCMITVPGTALNYLNYGNVCCLSTARKR